MNRRQRDILEALDKRKSESQSNLEMVRQECGSFAPVVFRGDWRVLLDERLVIGNPANDSNERITGTGRITALGEEALKEIRSRKPGE